MNYSSNPIMNFQKKPFAISIEEKQRNSMRTIKTATKMKKKNSIFDTKSGPLMGHFHPGLKGRTLYEENEIV